LFCKVPYSNDYGINYRQLPALEKAKKRIGRTKLASYNPERKPNLNEVQKVFFKTHMSPKMGQGSCPKIESVLAELTSISTMGFTFVYGGLVMSGIRPHLIVSFNFLFQLTGRGGHVDFPNNKST